MPAIARRRTLLKPAPEADPRFRKVMEQLKQGAARTKAHPPAIRKAREAGAAAKGPPNERLASGKAKQVEKIQEAPTKKPEKNSFLAILREQISQAMPKTLADTENFMKGGSSEALKGGLKGNVNQQKDEAAGGVKSASKEAPKESGAAKEVTAIPPEGAPATPAVNGPDAMPAPKPDAEVSLQDSKQDADQQMKDAEVTSPQLQKANDPRFSAVLSAKDAVGKQADAAPGQYRAEEKGVAAGAAATARAAAGKGAHGMVMVRGGANSAVLTKQQVAKAKDEAARKKVVDQIEAIYNKTKTSVETKLANLETEVGAMFDAGVDAALNAMTAYVEQRLYDYKWDRYLNRIGGSLLWIKDQFVGLPDEVNAFYEAGRARFTATMDALVVRVADLVERKLKEAKNEVAKGQAEIKTFVDSQPKELQGVAQAAQKEVAGRFEELERGIEDKKNQLAQQLAQKYKEAFDKANESLKKIQDANKGLVAAFVEKLGEIIKILLEFKDKLMALLRKGADAIKLILADPIGFLSNLISAVKQGIQQFVANIWTHLKKGFMTWLFGSLAEAGIEIPSDLSLVSILKLVLAVLGITYERMRAKAVKLIGERAVKLIEKLVEYVKALITGGPAKLWEMVKDDLSNLKEMVIDAIQNWLIETIIKQAVMKLVSMFNPVGAIVQAVLGIYHLVTFLIEKASQIMALIEAVINSVTAIAQGAIGAAANWIENSLAKAVPLVIGFLAELLGLGGISKKIKEFITKIQNAVDKAIDKAIAKVVAVVKKLFGRGADDKKAGVADPSKQAAMQSAVGEVSATMAEKGADVGSVQAKLPAIKAKYALTALEVVQNKKGTWHAVATINPTLPGPVGVLFTPAELAELDKVAQQFAASIKGKGPAEVAAYKAGPEAYLATGSKVETGKMVEAAAAPALEELAKAAGCRLVRNPRLQWVNASGAVVGGAGPELDYLVVGPSGLVRVPSAKIAPPGKFKATKDRRSLRHFAGMPTDGPAVPPYLKANFGVNKLYDTVTSVKVVSSEGVEALSGFRAKYFSAVVVDTIEVVPVTPGPSDPKGLQLRATAPELIQKTVELMKKYI